MSTTKTKIAAGTTVLALGGLAAVAIGQTGEGDTKKPAAAPVVVRTETIRRTIHVVKHEKPKHLRTPAQPAIVARVPSAAPPPAPPPVTAAGSAPAPAPVAAPVARSVAPAPVTHHVVTRTSGSAGSGGGSSHGEDGGEREREHEGGDD
jgi:hypothetical protein